MSGDWTIGDQTIGNEIRGYGMDPSQFVRTSKYVYLNLGSIKTDLEDLDREVVALGVEDVASEMKRRSAVSWEQDMSLAFRWLQDSAESTSKKEVEA